MSAAIELSAVGKRYEQLDEQAMLLRSLMPTARPTKRHVWALRNLNLRLNPGEALGVVGHNGAGKTTLLRLLAGVTSPTEGHVRVVGRIGPLISLGVGFHPELSGRENVQLNGMLLGLTARQVADRFDQIVEFAELQAFIDTPVKFYSSGMFMRLGFAVVAHTEPSILLIDEILAVGDAKFQLKCFDRLRSLQDSGASIVMVSHSMSMIRQICQRAVVIRGGRLVFGGGVEEAIAFHESQAGDDPLSTKQSVEFLNCALEGSMSNHVVANYDETVAIQATVRFLEETVDPVVLVGVRTTDGVFGGIDVTPVTQRWRTFKPGEETDIKIAFPARLSPGAYRIILEVKEATAVHALARRDDMTLTMSGSSECGGLIDLCAGVEWS